MINNSLDDIDNSKPDRKKAWDHFYQNALPNRKFVDKKWVAAEPGETEGKLYPVIETSLKELGPGFGFGIGLYFRTLIALVFTFLLLGILNSYNIFYYSSCEYAGDTQRHIFWDLKGSAACQLTEVVCLDTACSQTAEHRLCRLATSSMALTTTTLLIMLIFLIILDKYQRAEVENIDISEQTAQDYSVVVHDPQPDAHDPDKWEEFFKQFGQVTYVTCALDNAVLLRALLHHKAISRQLRSSGPPEELSGLKPVNADEPLKPVNPCKQFMQMFGFMRDSTYWRNELIKSSANIRKLGNKDYQVVKVFCTFETEAAQRKCLGKLTTGRIQSFFDRPENHKKTEIFNGNVLAIEEAPEPEDVVWENLHVSFLRRLLEVAITFSLTVCMLVLVGVVINSIFTISSSLAAIFISVCNATMPEIIKVINSFETHPSKSSLEKSLLLKLVLSRWATSALILFYITPFNEMISAEFIGKVQAILWADAFTTPILRLIDPYERLNRHVLSRIPFLTPTQESLNSYFSGTSYFLAERYTDMTKTLFLSLFYMVIDPQGLFISALAFLVCFWVDKYCLLRLWRRQPKLDASLTQVSRGHIALAILATSVITFYYYAAWPFDKVCPTSAMLPVDVLNNHSGVSPIVYRRCLQFPDGWLLNVDTDKSYMAPNQKLMVRIFGVWNFILLLLLGLTYFGLDLYNEVRGLFKGIYRPIGADQNINYSDVENIQAYIPQISVPEVKFTPFLAVDLSNIDDKHICFSDEDYGKHNLNLPELENIGLTAEQRHKIFSRCKRFSVSTYT